MSVRKTAVGRRNVLLYCMPAVTLLLAITMVASARAQEDAQKIDVTATDQATAAYNASHFLYHVLPSAMPAGKTAIAARSFGNAAIATTAATIPAVPPPGFYGEDLKFFGGKVLQTVTSHNIYVNLSTCKGTGGTGTVAACWGNPREFIEDLSNSSMIHLTDQYVHSTANNRYPAGASAQASISLFAGDNVVGQNDLLAVVHAVASKMGTGYGHIYHVFLPKGVDTCFDLTNVCYSPDNLPSFVFCAYHGSVTFSDIGHVILSIEPYQDVLGCAAAPPNPNGQQADSTNAVLSHELFESITDPDPGSGWVSFSSLLAAGFEIGDLCEPLTTGPPNFAFLDPTIQLSNGKFELQGEYSNKYHACAFAP